jgi:hypothetical protein
MKIKAREKCHANGSHAGDAALVSETKALPHFPF